MTASEESTKLNSKSQWLHTCVENSNELSPSGAQNVTNTTQYLHQYHRKWDWKNCAFCKFADDTKPCSAIASLKGRGDIKMDFDRPKKWDNLMRFSRGSTRPNATSGTNLWQFLDWGDEGLGNGPAEKDWQGLEDKSLDYCIYSPESKLYPGLHQKNLASRSKEVGLFLFLPLHHEMLTGVPCPALESIVQKRH